MSVRRDGSAVRLEGECRVEEAEALVALLQGGGIESADLSGCRRLHSAVAQALIAFGVPAQGGAEEPFMRDVLIPALQAVGRGQGPETSLNDGGRGPTEIRS
jgi:hypothetical protein